jgi:signal transduction histidine kinase
MNAPPLTAIIRRKLLALVLAPSLVFTLVLGSVIAYRQYAGLTEHNAMLAQSLARYVEAYMTDARHALRHAALEGPAASERILTTALANLYAAFPHFERLLWIDANGDIVAAYPSGMVGMDFPFLPAPAQDGQEVSLPAYAPGAGGLSLYVTHTALRGWRIVAEMDLQTLREHLDEFAPPGATTQLLLADGHGNLIVHPDETLVRQQANVGGWPLFADLGSRERLTATFRQDGVTYAGAVVVLPEMGWRLVLYTPLHEILVPVWRTVAALILFLLAFFSIIAASFRYELHRRVVAPLADFAATLQQAARGDYRNAAVSGADSFAELGVMEHEFTAMAATIAGRERDLRHSRAHLKSIIDSLNSAVLAVDAQARISLMNEGAARMCGLDDPGQARGRDVYELFPILRGARRNLSAALAMGRASTLERQPCVGPANGANGAGVKRSAFLDLSFAPLTGDEASPGAVVRIADVTTRAQLEEIMIQTEKMMSVGGLAAGMAHEINNPLGGILQSAQNIRRRTGPELPANHRAATALGTDMDTIQAYLERRGVLRMLDGISDSGQRAAAIVANMLNFSRRSTSNHAPTDLHALIERTLALAASDYDLKKRYDFRKVNVERTFDPGLPPVPCTPTEIEQVLLNLFKNAAQAMSAMDPPPDTPTLTVTTRKGPGYAEIRVRDNGPGIGPENRKRIFEPFFTTKAPGEGTGLGLSVSYFIVTSNHKGTIILDSEPGHGAEFIIRLPLDDAAAQTPGPGSDPDRGQGRNEGGQGI